MSKKKLKTRPLRKTLLIVVEGEAEVVFVNHLRTLYVKRETSPHTTIKNARGKGGAHVLKKGNAYTRQADYDQKVLILDTDVNWGVAQKKKAADENWIVIESTPCFEAFLLDILNIHYPGDSQAQKKRFDKKFHGAAHEVTVIKKIYSQEVLNDAALRMENLAKLIDVIRY